MKKYILFQLLAFSSIIAVAQKKAVTETGEEVVLYDDGTWKSLAVKQSWATSLDTVVCKKPASSTFLVKGEKVNYGIWINPKKWTFKKETSPDSPAEYNFSLVSEDAYMIIIPEKIEIPLTQLKDIAFKNAQAAAPDARMIREDMRKVNGVLMSCMQFDGTIQGVKFAYFCYYYSGSNGSIQILSYTSQNLFEKYKSEMEGLLNGFVILK